MVENLPEEDLKNGDIFNFYIAMEDYGFDFESFANNNFHNFISSTFIGDFISFRKAYLMRDLLQVRFYAHKFKGVFRLILSKNINEKCEKMQVEIQKGNINVEELYINIVKNMHEFITAFVVFAEKIQKPIDKELIKKFWEINSNCNEYEDFNIRSIFSKPEIDVTDLTIDNKKSHQMACCAPGDKCILFQI
jgi:hypothetical protein